MKRQLLILLLLSSCAWAQGGWYSDKALGRGTGNAAIALPGATIQVCTDSVCNSPISVYSDEALSNSEGISIVADSNGNFGFYAVPGIYFCQVSSPGFTTSTGTCQITPGRAVDKFSVQTIGGNKTFTGTVSIPGGSATPFTANVKTLNGIQLADQFAGVDACAKINAALTALPATGGMVDARGFQGTQACASNPFTGITKSGYVLLGSATFQTTASWIIPSKMGLFGVGRGDSGSNNTTIQAVTGFPGATAVIAFGAASPSFGIHVENLQVDCANQATSIGIQNLNSQEQTGVRHVLILNCPNKGLDIEGASQNSGPYEDIEVLNQSGGLSGTIPVVVNQVTGFRGLHGATINANGATTPTVAIQFDSDGTLSDIHCEHIGDCIRIGSIAATSAAVVSNVECGPTINNCVHISNAFTNQDIALLGIVSTAGNSILDDVFSTTLTASSEGFYFIGDGVGTSKTRLSSDNTVPTQFSNSASFVEGTAPSGKAGQDICYGDSTAHTLKCSLNNGSFGIVPQVNVANAWSASQTFNAAQTFAATQTFNAPPVAAGSLSVAGTGACATITTTAGGSWAGTFKCTGTTGASTITITPGITAPNGFTCSVFDETTRTNLAQQTSHNTTTCVLTATSVTQNDVFVFSAIAF